MELVRATFLLALLTILVISGQGSIGWTSPASTVVQTVSGPLRGIVEVSRNGRTYQAFKGIPYAAPPVGRLRFRDPIPPEKWTSVRDSLAVVPKCWQYNIFIVGPSESRVSGDEDCLYLNVFSPKVGSFVEGVWNTSSLPVMVWVHGGGFGFGSGDEYGPQYFMDADVILVTINYRLNALGFLSTEDFALPGNFGLKDQNLAFKWLQRNIQYFGGDPNKVTLFGQSAGAASIHYHMMSRKSRGLFRRAILQSGSALSPWALTQPGLARQRAFRSGAFLGCPDFEEGRREEERSWALLDCLRNKPARELASLHGRFIEWATDPPVIFGPVIETWQKDDCLVCRDPFQSSTDVPAMMGVASAEGVVKIAALSTAAGSGNSFIEELKEDFQRIAPLSLLYRETSFGNETGKITKKIKNFYFKSDLMDFPSSRENLTNLYSDAWFIYPVVLAAKRHLGQPLFYYFDHLGTFSLADAYSSKRLSKGATHCDDLLYLFNMSQSNLPELTAQQDSRVSKRMVKLWVNFAENGRGPQMSRIKTIPESNPSRWTERSKFLIIGTDSDRVSSNFLPERMKFWSGLKYREAKEESFPSDSKSFQDKRRPLYRRK